jgi:uncharacterized protein YndB with AHSA1/START domain
LYLVLKVNLSLNNNLFLAIKFRILKLKIAITILSLFLMTGNSQSQAIENTSYKNEAGERVLRIECTIPIKVSDAWKLFTNDEKLKKWIAPLAHIELKSGGYIITNYDSTKGLSDSSSIRLPILSFIDKELLVLKVNLNNNFVKQVRDNDQHLQEIIQFKEIDPTHTKIVSSMTGWGEGADWDKTYNFFAKGNEWTYKELLKNYNSN